MSSSIDTSLVHLRRNYDDYRTVRMSRDYYACRLSQVKKWNLLYEVVLAIGASGTVAGWYLWQTPSGKTAWALFAGLVAILSILKPILQLPKEIERYSKLHTGYSSLYYDLREHVDEIQNDGGITTTRKTALMEASKRYKDLALQDDPNPSKRLLERCQSEVNRVTPSFDEWHSKHSKTN